MGDAQPSLALLLRTTFSSISKGSLPPSNVLATLISKALGVAIIAGGAVVKLPQIAALLNSKSAAGLALSSFELENLAFIIHASYGFLLGLPINAYGEAVVMLLQNLFLLALVYKYARAGWLRAASVFGLNAVLIYSVLAGRVSTNHVRTAYDLNNVIMTAARVPQIIKNYRAKDTGQLSIVTYAANTFGCIARIFTSHQEGGGIAMIRGFVLGLVLNLVTALQVLMYRPRKGAKKDL